MSADDLNFTLPYDQLGRWTRPIGEDTVMRNPEVYENYLSRDPSTAATAVDSPFRQMHNNVLVGRGAPQYANETDLRSPGGSAYREVVVRSPELPSVRASHFGDNLPGQPRATFEDPTIRAQPADDILGWLRMQDYHPGWNLRDTGPWSSDSLPYTWVDELQSDRLGNLRRAQRELRGLQRRVSGDPAGDPEAARGPEAARMLPGREAALERAQANMGPWQNSWDALLFRRALQEAASRENTQGLAWTSGQEQALRYAGNSVEQYAPLYDRRLPDLARREARRLGLPPDTVGTGASAREGFRLTDPDDEVVGIFNTRREAADNAQDHAQGFEPRYSVGDYSITPSSVQVPFHYFNLNDEGRRAIERYGLPYFGRGGRV